MAEKVDSLSVSAPGRICLFGEHQDYLLLPVIACAISLRLQVDGRRRRDLAVCLNLPDTGGTERFEITGRLPYVKERDYFRSVVNVLAKHGFTFRSGFDCTVRGNIPINAGTASSSALVVAWVTFLARMSEQAAWLRPEEIAEYAYEAEVLEFAEPGGRMDQYAAAFGGTICLASWPEMRVQPLHAPIGTFVLGDSGEPKDTKTILARVRSDVTEVCNILTGKHADFSLQHADPDSLQDFARELSEQQLELLRGTVKNHQMTLQARHLLQQSALNHRQLGSLLNEHHRILRDVLHISTPKIEGMIAAALDAGALGAKINGSGGGGCMFAYAPENPQEVARAIDKAGGKASLVRSAEGVRQD
ncbi:MAG: mevalonate kinase [bacterium]